MLRKPTLHELDLLERKDRTVNVIEKVAYKWEKVATRLHFEFSDIQRIKKDCHHQTVDASRHMFGEWLEGRGRKPVTWATLIKVLNETELAEIARDLEIIMDDQLSLKAI